MANFDYNFHGLNMHGQTFGEGPEIIALHGWLDNSSSFLPLSESLGHYQIKALDLPGHGRSDHLPLQSHYHFIDILPMLDHYIDNHCQTPCILLGHSLGAAVASIYSSLRPHNVAKQILIEAIGPISSEADTIVSQLRTYLDSYKTIGSPARKIDDLDKAIHVRAHKSKLSFDDSKIISERSIIPQEGGYQWSHDERLQLPSPLMLTEEQVRYLLANSSSPTCFIQAKDGFLFDIFNKRMGYIEGKVEHHLLEGGHHLHMENPEGIAKIIDDFLNQK